MATAQDASPVRPKLPPQAFALLWFSALKEVEHTDAIVKRLLIAGSLAVIFGDSNSGKTFFALDLALAIAAGKPWRGRMTKRGLVIYVAGEGAASVRIRIAAYRLENPDITGLPFAIVSQAVDFLSLDSINALIETIRAAETECGEKVVIVVIDTFARALAGGDENSAQDVGQAVAGADFIRSETGACVAFVHHAGKDPSKGARGSSALRAATDTEILIEGQTGQRTATVTKQRDLETGESMPFELLPVKVAIDPDDLSAITSCVVKHIEAEAAPNPQVREMRGKAQRQFIAAMRTRTQPDPEHIWTLDELRRVGRECGLAKGTARSVVDVLTNSPYMQTTAFGYRFTDGRVEG